MSTAIKTSHNLTIRKYIPSDREAVRRIAYETSLLGQPELFLDDKETLMDALTLYFTDFEPESCFVAVQDNTVVGYLTGTKNAQQMNRIFNAKIIYQLFFKSICRGSILKTSSLRFIGSTLMSFLKGEFRMPDYSREYPALFHINLDKEFRGSGLGGRLIKNFENYLLENSVNAIHIATMSNKAKDFFLKNGYSILFQNQRSYLKYKLNKLTPAYLMGKKLI